MINEILGFDPDHILQVIWVGEKKEAVELSVLANPEDAPDLEKQVAKVFKNTILVDPENAVWVELIKHQSLEEIDRMSSAQYEFDRENVFKILEKDAEVIQQLAKENVTEVKVEQDVIESSEWILGYDQYNSNHSEKLFNLKLHIIEQSVDKMDKDDLEMIREAESPLELFSIIHSIME